MKTLIIDGSFGEGGGQILRSSLTLSMLTGTEIEIHSIRAGRKVPGLRKQHLTCVKASAEICNASITGAFVGSSKITFKPGKITPGSYEFDTGSAGSSFLVFQTIFPALMMEAEPTQVSITGGTHNLMAPPFEFMDRSFLDTLRKMGLKCKLSLLRYGYYPQGGGKINVELTPTQLNSFSLEKLSPVKEILGEPIVIRKSKSIAAIQERELLSIIPDIKVNSQFPGAVGPGNSVSVTVVREEIAQVFTGFGKKNTSPEITARVVANRAKEYASQSYFCDSHLTDQLLIPLLLTGGGRFSCPKPTLHSTTNAEIIKLFTGVTIEFLANEDHWECVIPKWESAE